MFDVKQKGYIDFGDFVRSLNFFHPNAPQEDKIDCTLKRLILDYKELTAMFRSMFFMFMLVLLVDVDSSCHF